MWGRGRGEEEKRQQRSTATKEEAKATQGGGGQGNTERRRRSKRRGRSTVALVIRHLGVALPLGCRLQLIRIRNLDVPNPIFLRVAVSINMRG